MLIDLTRLIINKLEKNYVNVNSRERETERQRDRERDRERDQSCQPPKLSLYPLDKISCE